MNPKTDKLIRRTTMIATVTASYFLLTADYGPEPNALDPDILGGVRHQSLKFGVSYWRLVRIASITYYYEGAQISRKRCQRLHFWIREKILRGKGWTCGIAETLP
ncbi:hypothetical protein RJ641_016049 [Dillenia turbinata]|uniref:Uncharacterized protein n=1 Tax=Dillenia turbinata TaxID=194707 RepID=A0AAN8Z1U3_9MAGN